MTTARTLYALSIALLLGALAACGKNPFAVTWTASPDTVLLYSIDRPELNLPSAFDFYPAHRYTVAVEAAGATGNWDLALGTEGDSLVFLTPEALGANVSAAITTFPGMSLDELTEAPSDSAAYSYEDPVPVRAGTAYVVRTRVNVSTYGARCAYYAKLYPLEVNPDQGTVRFVYDVNPSCNDRSLVPDNPAP